MNDSGKDCRASLRLGRDSPAENLRHTSHSELTHGESETQLPVLP